MLSRLYIENYALINHLDIEFSRGFSAITGETGAGKSILMDALELVLGKRADVQALLDPDRKCIVEGTFEVSAYHLESFFVENSLDYENQTIIRREINPAGKSRAFINDTPVNLALIKALGDLLVDIHAQHATTSLQDPGFQLSVVDTYAGARALLEKYRIHYAELGRNRDALAAIIETERSERSAADYKQFLLNELTEARIDPESDRRLEEELLLLTHSGEIKSALVRAAGLLSGEEGSITALLAEAESTLKKISAYHTGIQGLSERLKSDLIDLRDISGELTHLEERIEFNEEQMVLVQQRLDLINRLLHKHQVRTVDDLTGIRDRLAADVASYASLDDRIRELEKTIQHLSDELLELARELTVKRKQCFSELEREVRALLLHMGMPDGRFEIRHEPLNQPGSLGQDRIEFYFSANKGHAPRPLADIASGGELSRVMLSIKSIISERKSLPTIIFDEIDNGLSGDIAGRVGDVLAIAAGTMQIIAITHLPQIAGKASFQYSVYKDSSQNKTFSNIKLLNRQERISELAKMIGGRETTAAAVAAAEELLDPAKESITENSINQS